MVGEMNGKLAITQRPLEMWRFHWLPNSTQVELSNKERSTVIFLDKSIHMGLAWPAGDPEKNPMFFSLGYVNVDTLQYQLHPTTPYIIKPEEFPW